MDTPTIPQLSPLSVGVSFEFLTRTSAELARDIVLGLDVPNKLAEHYGLNPTQWAVLSVWPAFRDRLTKAKEELAGPAGVMERARRKAQLAVDEFVVMDMATISGNPKATNRDRIAAAQTLIDVGGMGSRAQTMIAAASPGATTFGGPLIQIVMPDGGTLGVGHVQGDPLKQLEQKAKVVSDQ